MGISVIICCYNGEFKLPQTLKYLAKQKTSSDFQWEILVIDNASTDNTEMVAIKEWATYGLNVPLITIREPKAGLTYARRTGALNAKYQILLFCDDDNWLEENYLSNMMQHFVNNSSLGIVAAGRAYGEYEIQPPTWFLRHKYLCAVFETRTTDECGYTVSDNIIACGAGMGIRKDLLLDYFSAKEGNVMLDRTGNNLLSGGDSDINYYVLNKKYGIGKFVNLSFYHFMPKERIDKGYLKKLAYSISYSAVLLNYYNHLTPNRYGRLALFKNLTRSYLKNGLFDSLMVLSQYQGQRDALKYLKIS